MSISKVETWKPIVARKQAEQEARIPREWRLKNIPSDTTSNVLDIPKTCGILTATELQLTETSDATALLQQLTSGRVKAVDVVTAFCKRAAIAQQLVSFPSLPQLRPLWLTNRTDKMPYRNLLRRCHQQGQRPGRAFQADWPAERTSPWLAHLSQGHFQSKRLRCKRRYYQPLLQAISD